MARDCFITQGVSTVFTSMLGQGFCEIVIPN